jgi:hypothetical protein
VGRQAIDLRQDAVEVYESWTGKRPLRRGMPEAQANDLQHLALPFRGRGERNVAALSGQRHPPPIDWDGAGHAQTRARTKHADHCLRNMASCVRAAADPAQIAGRQVGRARRDRAEVVDDEQAVEPEL